MPLDRISIVSDARSRMQACINAGANDEAIAIAREVLSEPSRGALPSNAVRAILSEEARAHRNIGEIQTALACYTEALESAHEDGDELDIAWQLVLLGKFFGKYLNRHVFFHACLEEARRRYDEAELTNEPHGKRHAVLFDLLGSYHRRLAEHDPEHFGHAENAYLRALDLHRRPDGISRATCHLAYVRALWAAELPDPAARTAGLRAALRMFTDGAQYTFTEPSAVRGRATRYAQLADLHFRLGQIDSAQEFANRAVFFSERTRDNRALIETAKVKAALLRHLGRLEDAVKILQDARGAAGGNKLHALQRNLNALLIDLYFEMNFRLEALPLFEENDRLVRREVEAFDVQLRDVLNVFRKVAPHHADRYLFEGLQRDQAALIEEMLVGEQHLRDSLATFERMRSSKLQDAIFRFARSAQRHRIKNDLFLLGVDLRVVALDVADGDQQERLREIARRIENLSAPRPAEEQPLREETGEVLLLAVLEHVAANMIEQKNVSIERGFDVQFLELAAVLLHEAFIHLVENVRQAVAAAPPPPGTPHLLVTQEKREDGLVIRLLNPGANPVEHPSTPHLTDPEHGFDNAARFFEVLNVRCTFDLVDGGPASPPHRTNCVTLEMATRADFHRIVVDKEKR